ncbi:MAG: hypothetical protein LLF94_12075 [Chlamydiales bacterium]|nr:hypothetical protein [Chlamydiales bacterium]
MSSNMSVDIFTNRDFESLYQLQEKLEVVGDKSFYLKISGKDEDREIVVVQGRLWRVLAFIGTLFGVKSYNLNQIQQMVFEKLECVEKASEGLTNIAVGQKVTHSCEHIQNVFFTSISSEKCKNKKPDDKSVQGRIKALIQKMDTHFQPIVRSSDASPKVFTKQVPSEPVQSVVEQFFEKNRILLEECFSGVGQKPSSLNGLENALEKRVINLVGMKGADTKFGKLAEVLPKRTYKLFWSLFEQPNVLEGSSYLLVRKKLDNYLGASAALVAEENRLSLCKKALEAILQGEAMLKVYVDGVLDAEAARALLTLELEAGIERILNSHPDDEQIKELRRTIETQDMETITVDTLKAQLVTVCSYPECQSWRDNLEARFAHVVDPVETASPVAQEPPKVFTKGEVYTLLHETIDVTRTPLLSLGINVDEIVDDEELQLEDTCNELILSILDNEKTIDDFIDPLNVLYKKEHAKDPDSVFCSLCYYLLNNLTLGEARKRYDPTSASIPDRLTHLQTFAGYVEEAKFLRTSLSDTADLDVVQSKRACFLIQLRYLAFKLGIDPQATIWRELSGDPMYDSDKPFSYFRLLSVGSDELERLFTHIENMYQKPSPFIEECKRAFEAFRLFEKRPLARLESRNGAFEIEKKTLVFVKQASIEDRGFLVEAKYLERFQKLADEKSKEAEQAKRATNLLVLRQFLYEAEQFLNAHPTHSLGPHMKKKIDTLYKELGGEGSQYKPFSEKRLASIQKEELGLLGFTVLQTLELLRSYKVGRRSAPIWKEYDQEKRAVKTLLFSS